MKKNTFLRLVALVATTTLVVTNASSAAPGHTVLPRPVPGTATPAFNNGQVNAITQVGSTMVVGGTFTSVTAPGGAATTRNYVVAFDATTGALRSGFAPSLNGTVEDVLPGPTADTVYVGGSFTTVNGTAQSHVTLVSLTTGAVVSTFRPAATNGKVNTIVTARGRLILGGNFTTAGGVQHGGLAALNPTTGAVDGWMGVDVAQNHNDTGSGAVGAVGVRDVEATSDGTKLAVIGNFKRADAFSRDQAMVLDLGTASAEVDADWRTRRYEPYCFNFAFDVYVRGISVAPDDSYFVISSTGGQNAGTLCDTAARFEFASTGEDIQPTWVDYTGGDTAWSVEVTENAVYVGGHQRWMNNSDASDSNGQGSVPRPGLAALDPDSGIPLSWNPGRNPRGAAAFTIFATSAGLWVGSDTDYFGNFQYRRPKIGFFPLAGGAAPLAETVPTLPADVYLGGARTVDQGNVLYRVNSGGASIDGIDGGPSWVADDGGSSPLRNDGSNAAGYSGGATVDATVPASTPLGVFDSERWSPSDNPRMSWDFPTEVGVPLQVRLYFANRCSCTSGAGQRSFDVDLDGSPVLDNFDIVAATGDQRGTMRSFTITSDGNVDIDFAHNVENPLINAIEIVRTDRPAPVPATNSLSTVSFDGSNASAPSSTSTRGINWNTVRGAFQIGSTLFTAETDGYLYRRTFTATTTGTAVRVDPYNDPLWADVATGSGNTYRGRLPDFYNSIAALTGLFYSNDRVYFTMSGDSNLYWRWFNADSGIVGSQLFTANGGRSWSDTAGMFKSGNTLYVVDRTTGDLGSIGFASGAPQGSLTTVGDSVDWRAKAVFLGPTSAAPVNQSPTASFTTSCADLVCSVNGAASSDPDGSIASYSWSWGDGTPNSTGPAPSHTYAAGTYTITLTVTDNRGATATTTRSVTPSAAPVNQSPTASFTTSCADLVCSVNGAASSDPDGSIASYSWSWGDGTPNSTGPAPSHTYAAGTYTITLTVTDNAGATATTTRSVSPATPPATAAISHVGAASSNANSAAPTVTVPSSVVAGDTLILVGSYGVAGAVPTTPQGWSLVGERQNSTMESYVWTKQATAADASATVRTTLPTTSKSALVVTAYRGTLASNPLQAIASSADASTAQHVSPVVQASAGNWVFQIWTDKSSSTTAWTAPTGVTVRDTEYGSGAGRMTAIAVDSGAGVPAGSAGGRTATTDVASGRGVAWTIALNPGS